MHTAKLDDPLLTSLSQHHFHLLHNDDVRVEVKVTNNAEGSSSVSTSGFVIDLTEPVMMALVDGDNIDEDMQYTVCTIRIFTGVNKIVDLKLCHNTHFDNNVILGQR